MKIIDTSAVSRDSWLPLLGNYGGGGANSFVNGGTGSMAGIDFIQQSYTECLNAIAEFAIADTTLITVMYGCNQFFTPPYLSIFDTYYESYYSTSTSYGINPGWAYYQGELYYVSGLAYTAVGSQHVNATITSSNSTADAALFSDAATHSVHKIRTIALSVSSTAHLTDSGVILQDYNYWKFANSNSNAQTPVSNVFNNWITNTWDVFTTAYNALTSPPVVVVGTTGNPQFENGWVASGLLTTYTYDLNPLSYCKLFNRVYLCGEIHLPATTGPICSTIFHLPPGYHPLSAEEVFAVPDITASNYATGGNNVGNTWYIWVQSDGAVTFLGNISTGGPRISLSGINFLSGVYKAPVEVLAPVTYLTDSIS